MHDAKEIHRRNTQLSQCWVERRWVGGPGKRLFRRDFPEEMMPGGIIYLFIYFIYYIYLFYFIYSIYLFIYLFIFLAASGLHCGVQDLHCGMRVFFVVAARGLFVAARELLSSRGMRVFSL